MSNLRLHMDLKSNASGGFEVPNNLTYLDLLQAQDQSGFGIPEDVSEKALGQHEFEARFEAQNPTGHTRSCSCHSGRGRDTPNILTNNTAPFFWVCVGSLLDSPG